MTQTQNLRVLMPLFALCHFLFRLGVLGVLAVVGTTGSGVLGFTGSGWESVKSVDNLRSSFFVLGSSFEPSVFIRVHPWFSARPFRVFRAFVAHFLSVLCHFHFPLSPSALELRRSPDE
jgi:hypothetical protein